MGKFVNRGLAKPRNLMKVRWISALLNLRHRIGRFNLMWRWRNMPSTTYSALNAGDLGQRQPSKGLPLHRRDVQYIEDIDLEQEYNIICFKNKKCEEQPHPKCPHHEKEACIEFCKNLCREGKKDR